MASMPYTEKDITLMVHKFYANIRQDALLGPIFDAHVDNWDVHLATMVNFWESLLLGAASFKGNPMPKHAVIPELSAELFERWLALFQKTNEDIGNVELTATAQEFASRIARRLWFGYQISNFPGEEPLELFTSPVSR